MSAAAHPVGGDDLTVRIEVGAGACVRVRSVAAMLVWPGSAGERSRLRFDVELDAGARLDVAPEPTVPVRGCDHRSEAVARLAPDAALRWRDDVVLGRSGEDPGRLESMLRIERGGSVLFATGTRVGGDVVGWAGPAVTAGHRRLVTDTWVGDWDGASRSDEPVVADADGLFARHEPAPEVAVVCRLEG